jgi:ribosomal protein L29
LTATARTRQIRKDIARIKTIQTEREIEAELAMTVSGPTE